MTLAPGAIKTLWMKRQPTRTSTGPVLTVQVTDGGGTVAEGDGGKSCQIEVSTVLPEGTAPPTIAPSAVPRNCGLRDWQCEATHEASTASGVA